MLIGHDLERRAGVGCFWCCALRRWQTLNFTWATDVHGTHFLGDSVSAHVGCGRRLLVYGRADRDHRRADDTARSSGWAYMWTAWSGISSLRIWMPLYAVSTGGRISGSAAMKRDLALWAGVLTGPMVWFRFWQTYFVGVAGLRATPGALRCWPYPAVALVLTARRGLAGLVAVAATRPRISGRDRRRDATRAGHGIGRRAAQRRVRSRADRGAGDAGMYAGEVRVRRRS